MVYNTRPGQHVAFETARAKFESQPFFAFRENHHAWVDPTDYEPDNMNNILSIPGSEVRRQTFDYVNMLKECVWGGPSEQYNDSFVFVLEVRALTT